jgi:hypothetical protein
MIVQVVCQQCGTPLKAEAHGEETVLVTVRSGHCSDCLEKIKADAHQAGWLEGYDNGYDSGYDAGTDPENY